MTPARGRFVLGLMLAVVVIAALAEAGLRLSPPSDLHPYLGEDSPLEGPFVADDHFAVAYRDPAGFLSSVKVFAGRPTWAMFGNSFVQAPGMLADTARARLTSHHIFNLGKNELIEVRLAQIKHLLEAGFKPERIFFELMPVDLLKLGAHPLSTMHITERGAITYQPGSLASVAQHSRLALAALVRSGQHCGNRNFRGKDLAHRVDPILRADLKKLFANLARLSHKHGVPVTILLIPTYHQIARGDPFVFQDTLTALFKRLGLDVFDPRSAFLAIGDKESLFIPDRHFSATGNELLLAELLAHVERHKQAGRLVTRREP